jgi:hypothetical protein
MLTFRNILCLSSSRRLNFICWRFGTFCVFHLPGVWILYADVSEHSVSSIFPASEFYMLTFRNILCFPSSRRLNFICWRFGTFWLLSSRRLNCLCWRFGTFCVFHLPGVCIVYADVSEHSVPSIFPASEFYMLTFRNILCLPSSRRLNFICRRFGTLSLPPSRRLHFICWRFGTHCFFHLPGVWILYADVSGHSVPFSRRLNVIYRRFGTLCLFHLPGDWMLYTDVSEHCLFHLTGIWILYADVSGHSVPFYRRLNVIYRRFGTLCLFHLLGVWMLYADISVHSFPFLKRLNFTYRRFGGTNSVPKRRHKIQTSGHHPKARI